MLSTLIIDKEIVKMKNITMSIKGTQLTVAIDLSKRFGKSASGKTDIIATTAGNVEIEGQPGCKIGINAYFKPVAEAKE
jgi:hypothetical protein